MLHSFTRTLLVGFVFCLMHGVAFGQRPGWKWQNPLPQGDRLNDIQFLDANLGWAVGNHGVILKTENGGLSWIKQNSRTSSSLFSVKFLNSNVGLAVGTDGVLVKTTNGGNSWIKSIIGQNDNILYSVFFVNNLVGWATSSRGRLYKTTNGGFDWNPQNSNYTGNLHSIKFINESVGWVVGTQGCLLKTTNGGETWVRHPTNTTMSLQSIFFADENNGWAVGQDGVILKTTNGGLNWQTQASGTSATLNNVNFINNQHGTIVGSGGMYLKSSDGGQNWYVQPRPTQLTLFATSYINNEIGWVSGNFGLVMKTTDGGNSWNSLSTGITDWFISSTFINNYTGFAACNNGNIVKTTNGGITWINLPSVTNNWLNCITFTNENSGWAVGQQGTIVNTSNGGLSWQLLNSGTTQTLFSVFFLDSETGWSVGDNGLIQKTTDGGITWQVQHQRFNQVLFSVFFQNQNNGWAVGRDGLVLKTSNGGLNWETQIVNNTELFRCIKFLNNDFGWIVGSNGTIIKTVDGGLNWFSVNSHVQNYLYDFQFIDEFLGWAVGEHGTILLTRNGGISWQKVNSGTLNSLYSVNFISVNEGWAVGRGGTVLKFDDGIINDPNLPTSLIEGRLFQKNDLTCDSSIRSIPYRLVTAMPGPYFAVSDINGKYGLRIPVNDSVSSFRLRALPDVQPPLLSRVVCPDDNQYLLSIGPDPDTLSDYHFGYEITQCYNLDLQLTSNRRRRCFKNATIVSFFNSGNQSAPNAHIIVNFPKWVRPLSANRPHIALNDSIWQFDLGDVEPHTGGQIIVTDSVFCGNINILGLSQCTKATIYPAPNCPPPTTWSGAEVSVSGRCQSNGFAELGIYNRTAINMPDSVEYFIYLDSIEVKTGKVKLAAGDSLKYQVETNGHDVHITAMQVANHPTQAYVSLTLEGCTATTTEPRGIAMHFPIQQQPNSKTQCLPIIGAYDPNDKQVFPLGFTASRIVPPNTKLEYLVRFQNTGNDTAFTVYIIDTLNTNLNVESFEMGAASHPYQLSMQTTKSGKTWLRWQFNNILLPDSNVNEPKSHGFVQFRISPKANLPLGTQVYNEADIYFDFNPPILTNQTLTTFDIIRFTDTTLNRNVRVILPTGIPVALRNAMKLYPNPVTNNQLNINFAEAASLTLYDARGQVVYSKANLIGEHTLPVSLKRGMYVARMNSKAGSWSEKLVVE